MPTLTQGQSVTLQMSEGESWTVTPTGQAQISTRGVSGGPLQAPTTIATATTFGPYTEPGTLTIFAMTGAAAYSGSEMASLVSVAGISSALLAKWFRALSKARAGSRNARLIITGDSTTAGNGANGVAGFGAGGYPSCPAEKLARKLRNLGQTAYAHATFGNVGGLTPAQFKAWDTRIGGTGWGVVGQTGDSFLRPYLESTAGNTLTFAPTANVDTFVIWYGTNSGSRVFSWAIDGGSATNVDGNGTNQGIASVTVPAGSLGAHTLTINKVSGSGVYVWGIEAYDSTAKQVQVLAQGISGTRVADYIGATNPNSGLNALPTFQPDLTIWNQVINEWKNASDIAAMQANLVKIITAARVTGDVLLLTGVPTGLTGGVSYATQQAYVDAVVATAAAQGVACIDTWRQFGSGAYESDSSIYTDDTHPNSAGYEFMWDTSARAVLGLR